MSSNNVEVGRLELTVEAKLERLATLGDRVNSVVDAMKQTRDAPALPDGSNSIPALALSDPWVTLRNRLKALDPIVSAVDELAKVPPSYLRSKARLLTNAPKIYRFIHGSRWPGRL